jgi:hypothetical protein
MSNKDNQSQQSARSSSHRDISSTQHAKELNKISGQDDAQEPDKPNITNEEGKSPEEVEHKKFLDEKVDNSHDDKAPAKPNIPKVKEKTKPKVKNNKVGSVYNQPKIKQEIDRKNNKSKRTENNKSTRTNASKKDPVAKKTESPKKENSQVDQVIIYTHIFTE